MLLLFSVIVAALIFEFINGFHDTANAIATSVATKVLTPRQAIVLASFTNLFGALLGTAVAKTIAGGLIDTSIVNEQVLMGALFGAIIWNLVTWWYGIPSSSSHALIGGLCGGAVGASSGDFSVIIWSQPDPVHWYQSKGILWKVLIPMIVSPLAGFLIGGMFMAFLYIAFRNARPTAVERAFGRIQIASAAGMGVMHGTNDAQKTMGLIALTLVAGTQSGVLDSLPPSLEFLRMGGSSSGEPVEIHTWIKIVCALTMAAGTACGGWKIIKTMGHKMARLQPVNGFAAEASSSLVIFIATHYGIPVSTTHNISASIMGVGAAKRLSAVKWTVVEQMMWAWLMTLPCAGGLAFLFVYVLKHL